MTYTINDLLLRGIDTNLDKDFIEEHANIFLIAEKLTIDEYDGIINILYPPIVEVV